MTANSDHPAHRVRTAPRHPGETRRPIRRPLRRPSRRAPWVGFALAFVAALPAQAQERTTAPPEYGVQAGDKVIVTFFSGAGEVQEAIAGERIVDRTGRLYMPLVGTVDVRDLDAEGIRTRLEELYAAYYNNPVIGVTVQLRVNVTGTVGRPGSYFFDPSATVVDALAEAGGAGQDVAVNANMLPSDPSAIRLVRGGERLILDLRPDFVTDDVLGMRIQSGDWLYVPPEGRSRIRDEVVFWGSVVSFTASVIGLVILAR